MENFNTENYRQKILFLLRNDKENVAKKLIKQIAKENFLENNDINWLYQFFSPIFDEIFYELMFEKIHITNSTKLLLERLALPLNRVEESERNKIIGKLN